MTAPLKPERLAYWRARAALMPDSDFASAVAEVDRLRAQMAAVEALCQRWEARSYLAGRDLRAALASGEQVQPCGAKHPTNPTVVPCALDSDHENPFHWSSTGCTGSVVTWPVDEQAQA